MPGIVTPATIGWNIVSSSCRPRKYHGAFDGFGVLLKSASPSSGARTSAEKIVSARRHDEDRRELDDEQVRPHVHLVLRLGARLLDRARLDDREQPLRVTAGAGGRRRRLRRRRGGGRAAAGVAAAAAAGRPRRRRRRRRRAAPGAASTARAGARGRRSPLAARVPSSSPVAGGRRAGAAAAGASAGCSPAAGASARRGVGRLVALFAGHGEAERLAALLAALEQVFGDLGHRSPPHLQRPGDAAVLADAPEVDGHEDHDHERQQQHVEHVPA